MHETGINLNKYTTGKLYKLERLNSSQKAKHAKLLGGLGRVVNFLDFYLGPFKSLGYFYFW